MADKPELNPETYFTLISDGLKDQGYVAKDLMNNPEVNEWLRDLTDELMYLAGGFEVGTALERRGDILCVRPSFGIA